MQPKTKRILFTISLLLLILTVSCKKQEPIPEQPKTLGDLQTTACNVADEAGTCNSRLIEVGIVLPEECCEILGKCC